MNVMLSIEKKGATNRVKVGFCGDRASLMEVHAVRGPRLWLNRRSRGLCLHPQPPLVQTHTVTITAASNSLPSGVSTTEVPVVPTKTLVYESSKVGAQPRSLSPGSQFSWWKDSPVENRQVLGGPGPSSMSFCM